MTRVRTAHNQAAVGCEIQPARVGRDGSRTEDFIIPFELDLLERRAVKTCQAIACRHPERPIAGLVDGLHRDGGKAFVAAEIRESSAFVAIQTVLSADPKESDPVLIEALDFQVAQARFAAKCAESVVLSTGRRYQGK